MIKRNFLNEDQCQVIINEYETSPVEVTHECCPHAFTGENIYSPNHVKRAKIGSDAFNLIHSSMKLSLMTITIIWIVLMHFTLIEDLHFYILTFID